MNGFVIRAIQASDRPAIRTLFDTVFGPWPGDAYWDWKYSHGAHGRACAWLVQSESTGMVMAHIGARVGIGRAPWGPATLAQVMDVMVHPDVRGQRLFDSLLAHALHALYAQDRNTLVFGFAGIRPFRLGARLGFYRGIRAHYVRPPAVQAAASHLLVEPLTPAHRLFFAEASDGIGFYWTPSLWAWRFLSHPARHYFWLSSAEGVSGKGCVVTQTQDQACWSVLSNAAVPDARVHTWRSEPLLDKGFGVLSPEPMMVSGQIVLPQQCGSDRLTEFYFEPAQTDVF